MNDRPHIGLRPAYALIEWEIHVIAASIIIPCFNQLEFTRHCFRALFRHTKPPFELIVIDNGSTDGTGVYLAGVQDSSPRRSRSSAMPATSASRQPSTRD